MEYLSSKLLAAYEFGAKAHEGQVRKNPGAVPYFSHPAAVGSILMKAGFSEDVVIAGLLHDVIEDTAFTAEDIREQFGDRVTEIVLGVTEDKKLEWDERQQQYNKNLSTHDTEVAAVSAADLLANRRAHLLEFAAGRNPWKNFSKKPKLYAEKRIRYDLERIQAIQQKLNHPFIHELEQVQQQVMALTAQAVWDADANE